MARNQLRRFCWFTVGNRRFLVDPGFAFSTFFRRAGYFYGASIYRSKSLKRYNVSVRDFSMQRRQEEGLMRTLRFDKEQLSCDAGRRLCPRPEAANQSPLLAGQLLSSQYSARRADHGGVFYGSQRTPLGSLLKNLTFIQNAN
jgi:hypothetical protein